MSAPMAGVVLNEKRDSALSDAVSALGSVTVIHASALAANAQILAEWDALAQHASEPNPFAERWYMQAALDAFSEQDIPIAIVRDGALLGLMALALEPRYAGLPIAHTQNWLNTNAFLGTALVRKGAEQPFWAAILPHLDGATGHGMFLHLVAQTIDGPVAKALEQQ